MRDFAAPQGLGERALAWLEQPWPPAPARPAATVVLVRDAAAGGVETFLLRRRRSLRFAGGMHVFPGGGVDDRDATAAVPWRGPPPRQWAARTGATEAAARALLCAAVRETFEECGVLLAGPAGAPDALGECAGESWERDRRELEAGDLALSDLLRRRDLVLRADLLRAWARWTTPEFEPRRFDTWFYLAVLPPGQRARHVGGEASESGWRRADDALADADAGRVLLLPPTLVALQELTAAGDVAALLRQQRELTQVLPHPVRTAAGTVLRTALPAVTAGAGAGPTR